MADIQGNSEQIRGTKAHDAVVDSNPVTIGGYASTSAPSAVNADGDAVHAWFSPVGELHVTGDLAVSSGAAPVTDFSDTITTGGVAQDAVAANGSRKYLAFYNISDTTMFISVSGTASAGAGSWEIQPGAGFVWEGMTVPDNALSVFCATTGKAYTAWEA